MEVSHKNVNSDERIRDITNHLLSIRLITEVILEFLESTKDLLNCRLVSTQLLFLSNAILRKRLTMSFSQFYLFPRNSISTPEIKEKKNKQFHLKQLNTVLGVPRNYFPAVKFSFKTNCLHGFSKCAFKYNLKNEYFQDFFNIYGEKVEHLKIHMAHTNKEHFMTEFEAMGATRDILEKIPNLRYLSLRIDHQVNWRHKKDQNSAGKNNFSPLLHSDPEYSLIKNNTFATYAKQSPFLNGTCFKESQLWDVNPYKKLNMKLESVDHMSSLSGKMFELIMRLAPNLKHVNLSPDLRKYNFYIKPLNRVYLIRHFHFAACSCLFKTYSQILACMHEQRIKLKSLFIDIAHVRDSDLNDHIFTHKMVTYINQLLKNSAQTLEVISFRGYTCIPGITWPSFMDSVRTIKLSSPRVLAVSDEGSNESTLFDNIPTKFPIIEKVELGGFEGVEELLLLANVVSKETARQVRSLVIMYDDKEAVASEKVQGLKKLYPMAKISQTEYEYNPFAL